MTFSAIFEEQNSERHKNCSQHKPPKARGKYECKYDYYSGENHQKAEKTASGMMFPHINTAQHIL